MSNIIPFPVRTDLQAAFIQLSEDGCHYLYTRYSFDRRCQIIFQAPDDYHSFGATSASLTAPAQPDVNVIDVNTKRPLRRFQINIIGAVLIERPFVGIAAIGNDIRASHITSRRVEVYDRSGALTLHMGLSEAGFHLNSNDFQTHLLFKIKTFDPFTK